MVSRADWGRGTRASQYSAIFLVSSCSGGGGGGGGGERIDPLLVVCAGNGSVDVQE